MGSIFRTGLLMVLIRILVLFTALPVHEFAHAFVADKMGDDTPRRQGRLTLSPFAHLDIIGSLCMLISGFGWAKPVQINPRNFKNQKSGNILVALAGPVSNILLSLIVIIIYKLLFRAGVTNYYLYQILSLIVTLNLGLAVFNLLPIPPLDGSQVLLPFLPPKFVFKVLQNQMYVFIGLLLILQVPGVSLAINYVAQAILKFLDLITRFLG